MKFPSIATLRFRGTRKWTVYDEDILPLWIAESDFPTAPPVKAAIDKAVAQEGFGYSPAPNRSTLAQAVSDFYADRYGWRPDPRGVFWIGDVVRGLLLGIQYFTRPGSPVIVPTPAYPPFLALPETAGRDRVEVSAEGGLDLGDIDKRFADGAGSILLCSPHNPLGYTFDRDFLAELAEVADRHDARILVDEIHAPLVIDGQHVPAASVSDIAARRCLTVTATSKAWNTAGLKCAQMIFSNARDIATWSGLNGVAKDGTGTLGIWAAEAAYAEGGDFLDAEVECLRQNRDFLVRELPAQVPGLKVTNPQATYLMWLDFRETAIGDVDRPAQWLRDNARVALNEGTDFGTGGAGHARLNFATSPEIVAEAVRRIANALSHTPK